MSAACMAVRAQRRVDPGDQRALHDQGLHLVRASSQGSCRGSGQQHWMTDTAGTALGVASGSCRATRRTRRPTGTAARSWTTRSSTPRPTTPRHRLSSSPSSRQAELPTGSSLCAAVARSDIPRPCLSWVLLLGVQNELVVSYDEVDPFSIATLLGNIGQTTTSTTIMFAGASPC